MFTSTLGGLLLVSVLGTTQADATQGYGKRTHDITIDDYFTLAYVGECKMQPTGGHVAFTDSRWSPDHESRNRDIWMVSTEGDHLQRLTFDRADDSNLSWSEDGLWLYFQSRRTTKSGGLQVWRVKAEDGTLQQVTRIKGGIDQYQLVHASNKLYFLRSAEAELDDRWQNLRDQFDQLNYGSDTGEHSELWELDLTTWRLHRIETPEGFYRDFAVTDQGQRVALIKVPDDQLISHEGWSQVDVVALSSGQTTTIPDALWRAQAPSPFGWIESPTWSDDGSRLAFSVDFDGYPQEVFVATFGQEKTPDVRKMPRTLVDPGHTELTTNGRLSWRPDTHSLCFLAESSALQRVYQIEDAGGAADGKATVLTPGTVVVDAYSFDSEGQSLSVVTSGLTHFNDVFLVMNLGPDATYRRLTNVNAHVDQWKLPQVKVVQWKGRDGVDVEGILELPPGYDQQSDGPLPMLVQLHGGPTSSSKHRLQFWIYGRTLFPARGWALLSPNYRGSTGYGDEFLTDLIEHENDIEVSDILAGIDAMVERGIADPQRLAVSGWSNGGYLTNCLIAKTDRFKAASSGAGVFDMTMQWAVEDTPGHVINYAGGLPWEKPEAMIQMSPLYEADQITTPTLIHCGANDARVPVVHSQALHRALSRYLDVPCELVIYPDTEHGLRRRSDRQAKLEWDVKWLEDFTIGQED